MGRPLLLLDVDGVLNIIDKTSKKRRVILQARGYSPRLHPTPLVKPFIQWAWTRFNVRWLTAWGDTANHIAKWAGVRPVAEVRRPRNRQFHDWKAAAVQRFKDIPGRKIVWVEDGFSDEAKDWAAPRVDVHLIKTDVRVGVTLETIYTIAQRLCR